MTSCCEVHWTHKWLWKMRNIEQMTKEKIRHSERATSNSQQKHYPRLFPLLILRIGSHLSLRTLNRKSSRSIAERDKAAKMPRAVNASISVWPAASERQRAANQPNITSGVAETEETLITLNTRKREEKYIAGGMKRNK